MFSPTVDFRTIVIRTTFGIAFAVAPGLAWGQTRASSANSELLLSDQQTVVTASKNVQRVSDVPSAVTIITEQQIRDTGATNLLDILRYAAGVDVLEQNGSVTNVSIRGFNGSFSNRILVMVDGRSIYQDVFGGVLWHFTPLLLSRIKRIEIVRGPGSALYGANAFLGVINIITKTPAELAAASQKTTFRLFTGERNTQQLEAQVTAGNPKDWSVSVGAAYNHSNGQGGTAPNRTIYDGYTAPMFTFDAEKRMRQGSVRFAAGNAEATADQVGTFPIKAGHGHLSFLSLTYAEDHARAPILARIYADYSIDDGLGIKIAGTQSQDVEVQQTRTLAATNHLVYGASFHNVNAISGFTKKIDSRQTYALYAQDEWRFARRASLFTGLRYDNHSLYGSNFSPRLGVIYHLPQAQTLRAVFGTAFRAPTIYDNNVDYTLPTSPQTTLHLQGNKALEPEHIKTFEIGYRRELPKGYLGASVYYNDVTNVIGDRVTEVYPSPPFPAGTIKELTRSNIGRVSSLGFELEAESQVSKRLRCLANYAYQDVRGNMQTLVGAVIPKHKINLSAAYRISPQWDTFLGAHFVGGVFQLAVPSSDYLPSYARFDARVGYHFGSRTRANTLSLVVTNLFDDRHLEARLGSPIEASKQGRTVYLSLTGGF